MEKEYKISWLKVVSVVLLIAILIFMICKFYPKSANKKDATSTYINNINQMKEAGFDFFKGNNLPTELGAVNRISLKDMISSDLLVEFLDENGKTCNAEDSYVQVTKVNKEEYDMKVFLSCANKSDYIVSTIYERAENKPSVDDKKPTNNQTGNNNITQKPVINQVYNITYVNNCKDGSCTNNIYYTVTFDANGGTVNGGSVATRTVKKGDSVVELLPSRDGYRFLGWYLNDNYYNFATPVTSKITLVAKWEKINENIKPLSKYTVTFDSKGGTRVTNKDAWEGSTIVSPKNPTRECFDFMGWYYYNTNGNYIRFDFNTPIYKNITLYAEWEDDGTCYSTPEDNVYTVRFDTDGGSSISSKNIIEGNRVTKPSNPTKSGYTFDGWYYFDEYGDYVEYNYNTRVYRSFTIYAEWSKNTSYNERHTVTFVYNNGASDTTKKVYDGGKVSEPATPTKSGYSFNGWYLNGSEYNFNRNVYNDIVLEADWVKIGSGSEATYCKKKTTTYYSTGYVPASTTSTYMAWTVRLDNLYGARNVRVTNAYHFSDVSYQNAYNKRFDKGMSMVNPSTLIPYINNGTSVIPSSVTSYRNSSLKASNFTGSAGMAYQNGNYWYVNLSADIKNTYGVDSYYSSNAGGYIYFVPYAFDITYTDLDDCVTDLVRNANKYIYSDYEKIN